MGLFDGKGKDREEPPLFCTECGDKLEISEFHASMYVVKEQRLCKKGLFSGHTFWLGPDKNKVFKYNPKTGQKY